VALGDRKLVSHTQAYLPDDVELAFFSIGIEHPKITFVLNKLDWIAYDKATSVLPIDNCSRNYTV